MIEQTQLKVLVSLIDFIYHSIEQILLTEFLMLIALHALDSLVAMAF